MDWKSAQLGDLIHVKHGYAFEGDYFAEEGPYIVLTPGNFYEEGGFKSKGDDEKYFTGEFPEEYILSEGDLIVAMTEQAHGLLGSAAFVPEDDLYLHNQRLGLVQIEEEDELDQRFLYYLFNSYLVRSQISATASGTKVRHTSPSRIYETEVELPPLPVQRRIAGILGAYDDLIANNRRRIELLEEMATSIFREWFVHYRFPGHADVEMRETEIGEVPDAEGWTVKDLQEVATVNRTNLRDSNAPEIIHYLTISNVNEGTIEPAETMTWEDSPGRAKRVVQHGDIIWSSVRPYLEGYGLMIHPRPNTIVSTGFAVLTPDEVPYSYLYQYVTTEDFVSYLDKVATGAAYPSANVSDFKDAQILVPPSDLIERYHDHAEPIYEQINNLRSRNRVLGSTRDLLLPRLVSGEINVDVAPEPKETIA